MTDQQQPQPSQPSIAQRRRSSRKLRHAVGGLRTRFARRRSRGELFNTERKMSRAGTPADVTSVRAKSSRHGKSTADKWNQ